LALMSRPKVWGGDPQKTENCPNFRYKFSFTLRVILAVVNELTEYRLLKVKTIVINSLSRGKMKIT